VPAGSDVAVRTSADRTAVGLVNEAEERDHVQHAGLGPSHQTTRPASNNRTRKRLLSVILFLALLGLGNGAARGESTSTVISGLLILGTIAWIIIPDRVKHLLRWPFRRRRRRPRTRVSGDPLEAVRDAADQHGGGVYLGALDRGGWRHACPERAVLLLGPPRSGKTTAVMIPALLPHTGPAVSTSTKPDVARATRRIRSRDGQTWVFDPTGAGHSAGSIPLRWSPIQSALTWDGALLIARAMTSNIGVGTSDRSHWANRAQAPLAPLLHAAAVHDKDMEAVVAWVLGHDLEPAGILLEDERCSRLAFNTLLGLHNTEDRERSSIFSAAADALQAYTSETALKAARDPNFDPAGFVRSADTIYIHAPAEEQAAVAPIVCGLLAEIRRQTYRAHSTGQLSGGGMLFALDEVANIAPLEELPQIASEGGGQGLILLAALQDLSQARRRWGAQADGFLTLFGTKLIPPGSPTPAPSTPSRQCSANTTAKSCPRHAPPPACSAHSPAHATPRNTAPPSPRNARGCCPPARSRTSPPATRCTSTASNGNSSH